MFSAISASPVWWREHVIHAADLMLSELWFLSLGVKVQRFHLFPLSRLLTVCHQHSGHVRRSSLPLIQLPGWNWILCGLRTERWQGRGDGIASFLTSPPSLSSSYFLSFSLCWNTTWGSVCEHVSVCVLYVCLGNCAYLWLPVYLYGCAEKLPSWQKKGKLQKPLLEKVNNCESHCMRKTPLLLLLSTLWTSRETRQERSEEALQLDTVWDFQFA